jgi:hypothetical protein
MCFATATSTEGKAGCARLPADGSLTGGERAGVHSTRNTNSTVMKARLV